MAVMSTFHPQAHMLRALERKSAECWSACTLATGYLGPIGRRLAVSASDASTAEGL
jgi:hypothetical protein